MTTPGTGGTSAEKPVIREKIGIKSELAIIPAWAFVLAAIVFVLIPVLFFGLVWRVQLGFRRFPFEVLIVLLPATALAFLALMIGYVNRDAGRRGMNRTLWTLLVLFVPNAIGFILYFLLREPVRAQCPKCGAVVDAHINYCPHCRFSFHPTCPQCKTPVRPGETFCAMCGVQLEQS